MMSPESNTSFSINSLLKTPKKATPIKSLKDLMSEESIDQAFSKKFKLPLQDKAHEAAKNFQQFLSRGNSDESMDTTFSKIFKTPVKENVASNNVKKTPCNKGKSPMPSPFYIGSPGKTISRKKIKYIF